MDRVAPGSTVAVLGAGPSGTLANVGVDGLVTHRFGLDEIQDAYDAFERPADSGALKVALFQ
ncbi:hypothetical protein [Nocardioides gilvus]|uniref:hypothetical protein n=1 Tax=Nocardioides gilvus TaxID=1735589 RepID=UPI00194DB4E9|nr:hypothetical protein [Nocardioides gilvus]